MLPWSGARTMPPNRSRSRASECMQENFRSKSASNLPKKGNRRPLLTGCPYPETGQEWMTRPGLV